MKGNYNITFGILSAFGIICVVMGHTGCTMLTFDQFFPYASFHMPLFFFISGYFYTHEKEKMIWGVIKRKVKNLLIPFYIIYVSYRFVAEVLKTLFGFRLAAVPFSAKNILMDPWIHVQPAGFCPPAWFVIALLMAEVMHVIFQRTIRLIPEKQRDIIILICYGFLGYVIISLGTDGLSGFEINVRKAVLGLFYYQLGYVYKVYLEKWDEKLVNIAYFGVLLLIRGILHYTIGWCSIAWYNLSDINESFFVLALSAGIGIMFWLRIAKILTPLIEENSYIIYMGKHTFAIMMHHLFALFVIQGLIGIIHLKFGLFPTFDLSVYKTHVYYVFSKNVAIPLFLTIGTIFLILLYEKAKEWLRLMGENVLEKIKNHNS